MTRQHSHNILSLLIDSTTTAQQDRCDNTRVKKAKSKYLRSKLEINGHGVWDQVNTCQLQRGARNRAVKLIQAGEVKHQ